ncbi:CoA protein activase [Clostridiales bacterium PH28_bin88]|nr:CoA protein activase [Clostridiales bacterium PH28_bin88]
MKVSFAHMGTSYIAFKHLVEHLGHEAVVPPAPSKQTLSYGVQYSPEFACIPFKMVLGTYVEVLQQGAEMIITSGGVGPCRAGLYGMLHEKILRSLGYEFELLVFDPPLRGMWDFIKKIGKVIRPTRVSWPCFVSELKTAWGKLVAVDAVEILSHQIRPYEIHRGETTRVFNQSLDLLDAAQTREEIAAAREKAEEMIRSVPQDRTRRPLRVGLIGEIYVVLEPFMNLDIEKTLGEMGVETHRSIYLTGYTQHNVMANGEHNLKEIARPYLDQLVGGHGVNSIGETILYARNGFDGVVQLAPFTCIPEIVAKSILPRVSRDLGIPVLTITIDEQTGKAGVQTRLEAFVDLLEQRRRQLEGQSSGRVPGC